MKTETPQPVYILEPSAELKENSTPRQDPIMVTENSMTFYQEKKSQGQEKENSLRFPRSHSQKCREI